MTNSHLLALVTFGSFALFAALTWWVAHHHPDIARKPAERKRVRGTAIFLFLLGTAFSLFAYTIDNGLRMTTLHEEMVPGSTEDHLVSFTVGHPATEHSLLLAPTSELLSPPKSEATIRYALQGPGGETVLPEQTETFSVHLPTRRSRTDWDSKTVRFTPPTPGQYTLRLTPITTGIPKIHIRVEDPLKRDGKRISGY